MALSTFFHAYHTGAIQELSLELAVLQFIWICLAKQDLKFDLVKNNAIITLQLSSILRSHKLKINLWTVSFQKNFFKCDFTKDLDYFCRSWSLLIGIPISMWLASHSRRMQLYETCIADSLRFAQCQKNIGKQSRRKIWKFGIVICTKGQ